MVFNAEDVDAAEFSIDGFEILRSGLVAGGERECDGEGGAGLRSAAVCGDRAAL
jgi:hypothetical protein